MILAPMVGLHVAIIGIIWVYFPIMSLLNAEIAAEHASTFSDWVKMSIYAHGLIGYVGSIFVIVLGIPVALAIGYPVYCLQRKVGLLGPISFGLIGLVLGFVCAGVYFKMTYVGAIYGPYNYVFETFMIVAAFCGWVFVWFASRPDLRASI